MKKILSVLAAALLLSGLFAVLPTSSAGAGGCIHPAMIATGAYYVYSMDEAPDLYEICQKSNPGSFPGYMKILSPFDGCLNPEYVSPGVYHFYTSQEEPELYALCQVLNPGTFPGYQIKSRYDLISPR